MQTNLERVAELTGKWQELAKRSVTPPTRGELIAGWSLLAQLNYAGGLNEPHTSQIIDSLNTGIRPDHNAAVLGEMTLDLKTKGLRGDWSGRLLDGISIENLEKTKAFSIAMRAAVDGLFTPQE
jgi:hypothetical protein